MSNDTLTLSHPVVRTHGALKGADIAEGARKGKSAAQEIADSPHSESAQNLAKSEIARSNRRRGEGVDSAKLARVRAALKSAGVTASVEDIAAGNLR